MSPEGTTIRVAVVGATGELGSAATALLERTGGFTVVAALGSARDWADMLGTAEDPSEVVLDVTLPHVSPDVVDYALTRGRDVVVGTTGWTAEKLATLTPLLEAHPERGVIVVPNFAAGAALATAFAATASRFFDAIEIIEAHGPGKLDSPSGTATRIAEQIHAARDDLGPVSAPHPDQRARGDQVRSVPVHSLRLPGAYARHDVILSGPGETLTISHNVLGPSSGAYEAGLVIALREALRHRGLLVGLDTLLGLGEG